MTDFIEAMDKLASEIAVSAGDDSKALGDKVDAFKALMPYYALQLKNKGKQEDSDDLPTFDNFQSSILTAEHANGTDEPGVRDRRRNGN